MEPNRRSPRSGRTKPLVEAGRRILFILLLSAAALDSHATGLAGRPLQDVLKEFQAAGMRLIFSSQIVTGQMRVQSEPPQSADPEQRLRALLKPHGLTLSPVPGGGWAVVAAPPALHPAASAHRQAVAGEAGSDTLDAIVVETSRFGLDRNTIDSSANVPRDSFETRVGTDEDATRAIQQLPGTSADGISARTHVRGSRDDETLYRFDGVELIDPFHLKDFQGLFSAIDPAVTDSVRFWSGDFPVDFGSVIGGVVDMTPRRVVSRTAEIGVSMLNSSLLLATPFDGDRGSVLVDGRISNLFRVSEILDRDIGEPQFQDLTARATWAFTPATRIVAGLLALDDSLQLSKMSPAQQAQANYRDLYTWFKLHHDWSAWLHSDTIFSDVVLNSSRSAQVDRPQINNGSLREQKRSTVKTLRQELVAEPDTHWILRVGAQLSNANTNYSFRSEAQYFAPFAALQGTTSSMIDLALPAQFSIRNGYAAVRWQPAKNSVVEVGARRDGQAFQNENERSQWNGRINYWQQLTPQTTLRIGWGQYSQPQAINGLDVGDGVTNLQAARRLLQTTMSLEQQFGAGWLLRIAAYDKHEQSATLTEENVFSFLTLAPEIEVDRLPVQTQSGRMRGAEISLSSDVRRPFSGWVTYTHSRAIDRIAGVAVPRSWDQPNTLQWGLEWKHRAWIVTGFFDWHTGWPFTPLLTSATSWQTPNDVAVMLGPRNSRRVRSYRSLDLRAVWQHPLRYGALEASFELRNSFDSDNFCCRDYQITTGNDGRSQLIENDRGFLPVTPIIGVRWRF